MAIIRVIFDGIKCPVLHWSTISEEFEIRQGCILSPILLFHYGDILNATLSENMEGFYKYILALTPSLKSWPDGSEFEESQAKSESK